VPGRKNRGRGWSNEGWRPSGWEPLPDGERIPRDPNEARDLKWIEETPARLARKRDQRYSPNGLQAEVERMAKRMTPPRDRNTGKLLRVPDPRFMSDAELVAYGQVLAEAQKYDWAANALPYQLEPENYAIWLLMGGRGLGKTRTLTETVRKWCEDEPGIRVAVVAQSHLSLRDTIFEGVSGLKAVMPPDLWNEKKYKRGLGDVSVELTNGSIITGYTAGQPDSLRGPEHEAAAFDEFAAWPKNLAEETMSNARMTLRMSKNPRIVIATTPKRVPHMMRLVKQAEDPAARIVITKGRSSDNIHMSEQALSDLVYTYGGTRKGRQELDGELLTDVEGTLWSLEGVEFARWIPFTDEGEEIPLPAFDMVVTGIDPSGSATGDATGIVTLGYVHHLRQIWVLECKSTKGLPEERYNEACMSAYRCGANLAVLEGSYGGDNNPLAFSKQWKHLVEIGKIDRDQPRAVLSNLKGDKVAKASPVAALYEQQLKGGARKIWHLEPTPENGIAILEDEQTSWSPVTEAGKKAPSPNSIDAFVHAARRAMKDLGMETSVSKAGSRRKINRGWQPR
jgi:phage terminase large subunit-like protein